MGLSNQQKIEGARSFGLKLVKFFDFSKNGSSAFNIRVVQSCHLLATYHVTYFTTYLIRRTRRRAISGIMNFVDTYSQAPTYCLCLSGRLFGNPNSGCSPDLFSLTCLLFPCVVVPSLIIASLVFSHTPPLLLGQRIHLLSRWLVQS
jgi:hypothetical protein